MSFESAREGQEPCSEAFAPAVLLGLSKQPEIGVQLKKQPVQELWIFAVLLLFTGSHPSFLPTAESGRNSLHYLLPCLSCHFY